MAPSEIYGNPYDQSVEACLGGEAQFFDRFECALYAVAPACVRCGGRIVEHGIEAGGLFFCCASCAHEYQVIGRELKAAFGQMAPTGVQNAHV